MPAIGGAPPGFTLLEVLVAFAIAGLALVVLYDQGVTALVATRASSSYLEAVSRARSRLAALGGADLAAGERQGDDGGGYHWHTRIAPLGSLPPPRQARPGAAFASGTALYQVSVEVSWDGAARPRHVTLETQLLGPAP